MSGAIAVQDEITQRRGECAAVKVNVCDPDDQKNAFETHVARFGAPSVVVLSAGIGDKGLCLPRIWKDGSEAVYHHRHHREVGCAATAIFRNECD